MSLAAAIADYVVLTLAVVLGVGSIGLFAWPDRPVLVRLDLSPAAAVAWNTLASLVFFAQHSIMVRRPVRARLGAFVPARYDGAFYAITSGMAMVFVSVLLQPAAAPLFVLEGAARVWMTGLAVCALAVFAWAVYALRSFDLLGLRPIREHLRGVRSAVARPTGALTIRGPYRWVRHPLYTCVIVLLWAHPVVSVERIALAALWTAWICVGARLEERDLMVAFGDTYRQYRAQVPILIPWRGRVAVHLEAPPAAVAGRG